MLAIVSKNKGMGKICRYEVVFENKCSMHFFVSHGAKGVDLLRHRIEDAEFVIHTRNDNNIKAMFEDYCEQRIKKIKRIKQL